MFQYVADDPVVLTRDGQRHLGTILSGGWTWDDGTLYTVQLQDGSTYHGVSHRELQYDSKIRKDQPNG